MTLVIDVLHRQLPARERHPLAPRTITMQVAQATGQHERLHEEQRLGVTLIAHFAYGAAAGSVYVPIARTLRLPDLPGGIGFGLLVWLVNYLGFLPAVGLFPPPRHEAPRRSALMVVAHVVWGAALGLLVMLRPGDRGRRSVAVGW